MATTAVIEQELLRHLATISAGQDPTLYYGDFASRPAINDRRNLSWSKPQLDRIRRMYPKCDITVILKNGDTHYPSQINGRKVPDIASLTQQDKDAAKVLLQDVIDQYCKGALNPY